jgi:peptidoglycan/xylan/chitin deacetylase (PgdA/CDA1 family)
VLLLTLLLALTDPVQSAQPRIVILGYHEVEPDGLPPHPVIARETAPPTKDEMARFTISTEAFRQQLDALDEHGYTVVPLEDVVDFVAGRRATLPARSAVITVDDGWRSTKSEIARELAKREQPFTAFIYARVIDRHFHHPYNLAWDDVAELAKQGVDVESHTHSHPFLPRARHAEMNDDAYAEWLDKELRDSRERIAEHSRRPVKFLAYPFGEYDAGVIAAAKAAGYSAAVTVTPGVVTRLSDPFALKRYLILHDTTLQELERWLEGRW